MNNPEVPPKQSTGFDELEKKENVSASELKVVLEDYAESGAAILASVVISIIERVDLTKEDLIELKLSAKKGVGVQIKNKEEQNEYLNVFHHILEKLDEIE